MILKRPSLIIWDWDNTLVDSRPVVRAALQDVAETAHLPSITMQDVIDVMGTHMGRFWQDNFGNKKTEAVAYYLSRYVAHNGKLELFPETKEVLSWVREQGISQIVVSNKRQDILDEECDRLGLRLYFDQVIGTDERHIAKPTKAFADEIFGDEWPKKAIMIGDGESDMEFAALLKVFGLFVRPGNQPVPFAYDARVPDLNGVFYFLKNHIREV